jgi:short-subunit dehydrogenase
MVTVLGPIKELTSEEIKRVTDVTYHGSVNGILVSVRRMLPRDQGHIIQIGSALAQSIPLQSAYCGAKHAVRGFLESFRIELMHDKSKVQLSEVHLPAVNTPQFEWMRNHMPHHPKPASTIYQPEVIAKAVIHVADNPRREFWVGGTTIKSIVANRFVPWLAERQLAKKGYSGQQDQELPTTPLDNLWQPVRVDYGAHGKFDKKSKKSSLQLWLNMNRKFIGLVGGLALGLGLQKYRGRT